MSREVRPSPGARVGRPTPRPHAAGLLLVLVLGAGAVAGFVTAARDTAAGLVLVVSSVLLLVAVVSLSWQTYAWRTPATFQRTGVATADEPQLSFSLLIPARHEETVLAATLAGVFAIDHPDFEVVVVVGHDDPATTAVARAAADRAPVPVRVVVDHNAAKNKPKALNTGLPYCSGEVVMVIDAEDAVQPGLLRLADTTFRHESADIVQTGVQLMDYGKSWWAARNVLEYFFWFRSRLHFHAAQHFITLGGSGIAIRRDLIAHLGGWDETCLAEDCDLGVRASVLGARVAVVYEPRDASLEETPTDLRAFFHQRVRWMQGFIQVITKGDWRRLPDRRQRLQAGFILATPFSQSFAGVVAPLCAAAALLLKAPVGFVLATFLPLVPTVITVAVDLLGLHEFSRAYHQNVRWRTYLSLAVSLPFYQVLLSAAAVWATVRHLRRDTSWSKTAHVNAHRDPALVVGSTP